MSMLGDAISHAALPGIVVAYWWSGERQGFPMLLGAGAFGMLCTFLIEFWHKKSKLQADAAIGITYTALFALGVFLIASAGGQVDLDQDCVLYGEIAYVPIDTWEWRGTEMGPRAVWVSGSLLVLTLVLTGLFYKELVITSFDPAYAVSLGISATVWHYLLMGMVSLVTVASFEVVGAILVVALLTAPAATAYLLTDRLPVALALACGTGVLASLGGYGLATLIDGSVAGGIATVCGLCFVLAWLFSPYYGLWGRKSQKLRQQKMH